MACRSEWAVISELRLEPHSNEAHFFTAHEWDTIEAATARIIPTDRDPGAREARVVRFIDRYLSGIEHIYASGDGSGFLAITGKSGHAWKQHIGRLQELYREGIRQFDHAANARFGSNFVQLSEQQQDEVLSEISGAPKPSPLDRAANGGRAYGANLQSDAGLGFFAALCLHTRQGFYSDPVYGGNHGQVGWRVIGFPGPNSLADTQSCSYSLEHLLVTDRDWADLVPHLRDQSVIESVRIEGGV
jgi:gluconate 2-dehydrogenase gamma chain